MQKFAGYLNKLGDDGWEMVGSMGGAYGHGLYFRRLKLAK